MPDKPRKKVVAPTDEELYRQQNYDPSLKRNNPKPVMPKLTMPKDTPVMRAPTPRERISDFFGGLMEAVGQNPAVNIMGKLNRDLGGEAPPGFKIGMMPGGPGSSLGKALAPNVKMMHPSVPPEFHAVEQARMPQSRTAPIDMNEMPSGKMEFLDPDVADFMNPTALDATTREGQNRLKVLQYLTSKR